MQYVVVSIFIVADYITGLLQAVKNRKIESSVMREGLFHKLALFLVMALGAGCNVAQEYIDLGIASDIPISTAFCTYIAIMELGSIIENIGRLNEHIIPSSLRKFFAKLDGGNNEV